MNPNVYSTMVEKGSSDQTSDRSPTILEQQQMSQHQRTYFQSVQVTGTRTDGKNSKMIAAETLLTCEGRLPLLIGSPHFQLAYGEGEGFLKWRMSPAFFLFAFCFLLPFVLRAVLFVVRPGRDAYRTNYVVEEELCCDERNGSSPAYLPSNKYAKRRLK
ncbi:hypothetical protein PAMA_006549 [Pampus argenteus]